MTVRSPSSRTPEKKAATPAKKKRPAAKKRSARLWPRIHRDEATAILRAISGSSDHPDTNPFHTDKTSPARDDLMKTAMDLLKIDPSEQRLVHRFLIRTSLAGDPAKTTKNAYQRKLTREMQRIVSDRTYGDCYPTKLGQKALDLFGKLDFLLEQYMDHAELWWFVGVAFRKWYSEVWMPDGLTKGEYDHRFAAVAAYIQAGVDTEALRDIEAEGQQIVSKIGSKLKYSSSRRRDMKEVWGFRRRVSGGRG